MRANSLRTRLNVTPAGTVVPKQNTKGQTTFLAKMVRFAHLVSTVTQVPLSLQIAMRADIVLPGVRLVPQVHAMLDTTAVVNL